MVKIHAATLHRVLPMNTDRLAHAVRVPKYKRSKVLRTGSSLAATGLLLTFAVGQWQSGMLLAGLGACMLGWYAGFLNTHRCWGPNEDGYRCHNAPCGGLVRGCHIHRWWRIKHLWKKITGGGPDQDGRRPKDRRTSHQSNVVSQWAFIAASSVGVVEINLCAHEPKPEEVKHWAPCLTS
jgi:hypothetical protein